MELFTLNRAYEKQSVVDEFLSVIWTERYYGDSAVEIVTSAAPKMIEKLFPGTFLGLTGSDEIMILETFDIENGQLKVQGISLLPWLNNRFIRTSAAHEDRYWSLTGIPGWILWQIVYNMCCDGSPYLDGTNPTGIPNPDRLIIPGLDLKSYDQTNSNEITVGVPYGPVYNALKDLATTYGLGMQITLESDKLLFRNYKGLDRSSRQGINPIVRFSSEMDSLANIKELQSIAALKTLAYAFAPQNPGGLATTAGTSTLSETSTGFDLRALLVFAEDITTDMVGGDAAKLLEILNTRAKIALAENSFVKTADGEIVPTGQFKYGRDYNLGDLIEVEGNTGVITISQVTEYIRSQDSAGEKAYPSITMVE